MQKRRNRYKQMEQYMTYALLADAAVFVLFLLFSGLGITWLKVITAILAIAGAVLCLAYLYLSRELLRPRSLWMTACAGAVLICAVMSLVLRFPCPAPKAAETLSVFDTLF